MFTISWHHRSCTWRGGEHYQFTQSALCHTWSWPQCYTTLTHSKKKSYLCWSLAGGDAHAATTLSPDLIIWLTFMLFSIGCVFPMFSTVPHVHDHLKWFGIAPQLFYCSKLWVSVVLPIHVGCVISHVDWTCLLLYRFNFVYKLSCCSKEKPKLFLK